MNTVYNRHQAQAKIAAYEAQKELLYETIKATPGAKKAYDNSEMVQYWLRSDKPELAHVMIQATKRTNGDIEISIQGANNIDATAPNFIDFSPSGEFMKWLEKAF